MSNRQPAGISKPTLKNEALGFITGQQVAARQGVGKGKAKEATQGGSKSGKVPQDDVRLTANIRQDLHLMRMASDSKWLATYRSSIRIASGLG